MDDKKIKVRVRLIIADYQNGFLGETKYLEEID